MTAFNWNAYRAKLAEVKAAVEHAKQLNAELDVILDTPTSFNGPAHFSAKASFTHLDDAGRFLNEMRTHSRPPK